jgi:hypothetical protein
MIGPRFDCNKYLKDKRCFYYGICENITRTETSEIFNFNILKIFFLISSNSRESFLEIGSLFCDYYAYLTKRTRKTSSIESIIRYSRIDWLSKQSFCYENQESVELISTMTGLTFGFHLNTKLYDRNA